MRKITSLLLCFVCTITFAQKKDCKGLLKEQVDAAHPGVMMEKIKQLDGCGLDSMDVMLLSNNAVITGFETMQASEKENQAGTYGDFLQYVNGLKKSAEYQQKKTQATRLMALRYKTANLKTWDDDTKVFGEVGYSKADLDATKKLLQDNLQEKWNYEQVFVHYGLQKKRTADSTNTALISKQLSLLEEQRRLFAPYCDTSHLIINNFYLPGFVNYEEALACAKKMKLPLLVYFNTKECADCRKMERVPFTYDMVREELLANYILADISCDDASALPKDEQRYSETLKRTLKTIGDKNTELEMEKFNAGSFPHFAVVGRDEKEIAKLGATNDWVEYLNFLQDAVKTYKNSGKK